MSTKQVARPWSAEREHTIKRQIVQRTGSRIQMLEVEVGAERVVVREELP
jgi:hypothetical protein